ncbi:hypothetical protein E4U42_002798 [Claviceps africana]|uniref:Uncharacterized protein n=1 Tax=Claviceps africana TaxID=83212 RepID=A0A8K0JA75_9HYPO|nr:hypothetical protein E4U42_002798 [Claviceps africana]
MRQDEGAGKGKQEKVVACLENSPDCPAARCQTDDIGAGRRTTREGMNRRDTSTSLPRAAIVAVPLLRISTAHS